MSNFLHYFKLIYSSSFVYLLARITKPSSHVADRLRNLENENKTNQQTQMAE